MSPEVFPMKIRKLALGAILSLGLFASGVVVGQNVNPNRHPNLAAAQRLIEQAMKRIDAAQAANEYDMHGHAPLRNARRRPRRRITSRSRNRSVLRHTSERAIHFDPISTRRASGAAHAGAPVKRFT